MRVLCSKRLFVDHDDMISPTDSSGSRLVWWRCSVVRGFVDHRDNDMICPADSNGSRLVNCTWARSNISLIRFESLGSNLVIVLV